MRRRLALVSCALFATLSPACALIFGIEELPYAEDAGAGGASMDASAPDGASDARDAMTTSDASDARDDAQDDDASDAADAHELDAGDASDAPEDATDALDAHEQDAGDGGQSPCDCPVTQDWSKAFASAGDVTVAGVAIDANGHVVIAGSVSGDLDVQGHVLPGGASADVFVISMDACGEPLFARRYGDSAKQTALAIAVDPPTAPHPNAIVITGAHAGTLAFGGASGPLVALTGERAFVARLDPTTGDGLQAISAGAVPLMAYRGTSVATSPDGSVLWTGVESDDTGIFVRRLDASMSVSNEIQPLCLGCAPLVARAGSNAVLTGSFQSTLDLVPGAGGILAAAGIDVFTASLVPTGASFDDAIRKGFGDNQPQRAAGVATDATGNVYLGGEVAGTLALSAQIKVSSTGGLDAFAAKLSNALAPAWIAGFGHGATDQRATAIALGASLAVVGDFVGSISAGNVLLSAGGSDAFLLALDPADGSVRASTSFGGAGDDHAAGVAIDANGKAVVAGVLGAPAFFGCGTLGGPGKSVFVAKRPIP